MISVLLDARKLGDGGIGVYLENLIDGFIELEDSETKISLLVAPEFFKKDSFSEMRNRWENKLDIIPEPAAKYSFSEYLLLAKRQREVLKNVQLFHSPHYTLPFFLDVPRVVTIHDAIHITNPDTVAHRIGGELLIRSALSRANKVITVSDASARTLIGIYKKCENTLTMIPNALRRGIGKCLAEQVEELREKKELPESYALFVGCDRPHKGFRELLRAWDILSRANPHSGKSVPKLVVVGTRFDEDTHSTVNKLGLKDRVVFYGEAGTEELSKLYSGAKVVVIPSVAEGFGLVALEALACGAPLVCTPVPSLREICGDLANYTKGFTARDIFLTVREVLESKEKNEDLAKASIARAGFFNRTMVARKTLAVYQDVQ